jgi:hypothetical protein
MLRRILVADFLIIVLLVFGGIHVRKQFRTFDESHKVEQVRSRPETFAALPALPAAQPQLNQWSSIASQNPFSFDRNDTSLTAPAPLPPPAPVNVGPKPILFGTFSIGSNKVAMLAEGQPGNRNARPMRVGDVIDGWEVAEIKDGAIAVRAGERVESVVTNDPAAQVSRAVTRTASTSPTPSLTPAAPGPIPTTVSVAPPPQPSTVKTVVQTAASSNSADLPPDIHPAPGSFIPTKEQQRQGSWVKTPRGDVFVFNPGL